MRIKLTISYDGALYSGWQRQPDRETVQERLEGALSEIAKTEVRIQGSGRTDTGVHAHGQVAHFDVPEGVRMPAEKWAVAVNTRLPAGIRIMQSEEVGEEFHARFSAQGKTYEYVIETGQVLHPHMVGRAWHVPRSMDLSRVEEVMKSYLGEHDFRHFSALRGNETEETSYVREVTQADVIQQGSTVLLKFSANGFMYKMVRILTGVAVSAGLGKVTVSEVQQMLEEVEGEYHTAKHCAPSGGLSLREVQY